MSLVNICREDRLTLLLTLWYSLPMSTYEGSEMPATRDIPAGKILLAEYGEVNETNRAVTTRLDIITADDGREYHLFHQSPGFECAGSCARWTNGYYAARRCISGTWHGRQFKTEQEARDMIAAWVNA